jgi:hypothetical protein
MRPHTGKEYAYFELNSSLRLMSDNSEFKKEIQTPWVRDRHSSSFTLFNNVFSCNSTLLSFSNIKFSVLVSFFIHIPYTYYTRHIMERENSNSSQNVNPPKQSRKSASVTPAGTHTSNIPQPTGSNIATRRRMFIDLTIFFFF